MPKLTTDFNVTPYFDDFDEAKKFFKILYRPAYSVQARELSQMQSILQNQIEQLCDYNFSDGDRVYGGEISLNTKINALKLKTNYAGVEIVVSNFEGRIVEGNTSGARAKVVKAEKFTQTTLNTLMINYLDEKTFLDDEIIQSVDTGTTYFANVAGEDEGLADVTTLTTSIASTVGSIVSIEEGVFVLKLNEGEDLAIEEQRHIPVSFSIEQNYPNPFNPTTNIDYTLNQEGHASLIIFNAAGQVVKVLNDGFQQQGLYSTKFNGQGLPSGIYFYQLKTDYGVLTKKMSLLK